jgi:hypothetical protein
MNPVYRYLAFTDDSPYRRFIETKSPAGNRPVPSKFPASEANSHGSYGALLFHPKWKEKRKEILTRDKNQCIHCKQNKNLQVHHRQYHFVLDLQQFRMPWDYPDHLLITLCEPCHSRGHSKFKVPVINV